MEKKIGRRIENGWPMSRVVVANSSCLIGLSKICRLDILQKLFGSVLIPFAVYEEVVIRGAGRSGSVEVAQADWIETRKIIDLLAFKTLRLTLGAGEAEAIVLASECAADFPILDDWRARQVALGLELPVVGMVALLDKAAEKGLLTDLPDVLRQLRRAGFRFLN